MTSLPLATNPVAIFLIVLLIILFAPVLLNKLKIPHIIGMIVAGVVIGPHGFNVLAYDSSFSIFGQVGLLYLMFLAGLEIDMYHLRLNLRRGMLFGLLTLFLPLVAGMLVSVYVLGIGWLTASLLGAMYASHTLISYPIVTRMGIAKTAPVLIAIVGTIVAVIGALLVLAAVVNIQDTGHFDVMTLVWLAGKLAVYCAAVMWVYPKVTRIFFKYYGDKVTQFVYVLAMVFLSAYLSSAIGLEPVLGAFFAGLVLNRFVPDTSPLMGRIEFVGNALFIPYFLIGVGMMIDVRVIANVHTLYVTGIMLAVALASKWLAAFVAQKCYGMVSAERRVMFGLTTAHTAVALAVVTVGYEMVDASGHRLMDATILNGTVLVILITCAVAPIVTSRGAQTLRVRMLEHGDNDRDAERSVPNTLVPLPNPPTTAPLVELAIMMPARQNERSASHSLLALCIRNDNTPASRTHDTHAPELARRTASALETDIDAFGRFDLNTVTGIINVINERDIDELIMGMHRRTTVIDSFFGSKIEQLMTLTNKMIVVSRCFIPINTVRRVVVYMLDKAQFETGFVAWANAVANIARSLGCRMIVCCRQAQQVWVRSALKPKKTGVRLEFREVQDASDFIILSNRVKEDDLFVVVGARPASLSYSSEMVEMPGYLQKYCSSNNLMFIYPEQFGSHDAGDSFADPLQADINRTTPPWVLKLVARWRRLLSLNAAWRRHHDPSDRLKL